MKKIFACVSHVNFFGPFLCLTAGVAIAADNNVSADQILDALQPKPLTRGLSVAPQAPMDPINRRVEVVNRDSKSASK